LRVEALEKKVSNSNSTKSIRTIDQPSPKKARLDNDPASVVPVTPLKWGGGGIVPPSTIQRMLGFVWSAKPYAASSAPAVQTIKNKGKGKDTAQGNKMLDRLKNVQSIGQDRNREREMSQIALNTATVGASPATANLISSDAVTSTNAITSSSGPSTYAQKANAIEALFTNTLKSAISTPKPTVPINIPGRSGLKESPSVKDLVKSFEEGGVLTKSMDGKGKGKEVVDAFRRVQSRGI